MLLIQIIHAGHRRCICRPDFQVQNLSLGYLYKDPLFIKKYRVWTARNSLQSNTKDLNMTNKLVMVIDKMLKTNITNDVFFFKKTRSLCAFECAGQAA